VIMQAKCLRPSTAFGVCLLLALFDMVHRRTISVANGEKMG